VVKGLPQTLVYGSFSLYIDKLYDFAFTTLHLFFVHVKSSRMYDITVSQFFRLMYLLIMI
jgi:hypothetical protein